METEIVEKSAEKTPVAAPSINAIVAAAVKEHSKEGKDEKTVDAKKDDGSEVERKSEVEAVKDEKVEQSDAEKLYALIKDPKSSVSTLRFLLEQAGGLPVDAKTSKTEAVAEAVETVESIFKKELGDDYSFLAEKLIPAVTKAVGLIVGERIKPVEASVRSNEQKAIEKSLEVAIESVRTANPGFDEFEPEIVKLMGTRQPSASDTPESYIQDLYDIAAARKARGKISSRAETKITRSIGNVEKVLSKAKTESSPIPAKGKLSLDEAIKAAQASVGEFKE